MPEAPMLRLANVEVVYDDVILVLKGLSLDVPRGQIVALLGSNGAGKSTTLKAISGLLHAEEGEVTDGAIELDGERIEALEPEQIVRRGIFQVMEGRRVFEDLTVDENLTMGGYTRRDSAALKRDRDLCFDYFPRLRERRRQIAGSLSYFLSTQSLGKHDLKVGFENYRSQRTGGNSQSSTNYVFYTDYLTDADGHRVLARQRDGIHYSYRGSVFPARIILAALETEFSLR